MARAWLAGIYADGRARAMRVAVALSVSFVLAAYSLPSLAQTPFYTGKTVTLISHTGAGTSGDLYSRALARYMPQGIPGEPSFIVQHIGGGGGKRIANHLYRIAAADGTVMASLNQTLGLDQIFSSDVEYNAAKYKWLGRITATTGLVMVYQTAPVKTLEDMKSVEVIFGANGKASQTYMTPVLMRTLLGLKTRTILGYPSSAAIFLAMARGEVHGRTGAVETILATHPDWLEKGTIRVLGELSLESSPSVPGVPLLIDLAPDRDSRETLELIASYTSIGIAYAAPPGVPDDRVEVLRRAFDQVMAHPNFLSDMRKSRLQVQPATGEVIQRLTARFLDVSPELVERAKRALEY